MNTDEWDAINQIKEGISNINVYIEGQGKDIESLKDDVKEMKPIVAKNQKFRDNIIAICTVVLAFAALGAYLYPMFS